MRRGIAAGTAARLRELALLLQRGLPQHSAWHIATAGSPPSAGDEASAVDLLPPQLQATRELLAAQPDPWSPDALQAIADVLDIRSQLRPGGLVLKVTLAVACATLLLFTTVLGPSLLDTYASFSQELPLATQVALVLARWIFLPVLLLMLVLALMRRLPGLSGRLQGSRRRGVEAVLQASAWFEAEGPIARTRTLASWLAVFAGHAPLPQQLEALAELAGPGLFSFHLHGLAQPLAAGASLPDALREGPWLPGLAAAAEEEAQHPGALAAYAAALEDAAAADLQGQRIGLIVQLVVGVLVGLYVVALYVPLFAVSASI